jgi:hypothetical protein
MFNKTSSCPHLMRFQKVSNSGLRKPVTLHDDGHSGPWLTGTVLPITTAGHFLPWDPLGIAGRLLLGGKHRMNAGRSGCLTTMLFGMRASTALESTVALAAPVMTERECTEP